MMASTFCDEQAVNRLVGGVRGGVTRVALDALDGLAEDATSGVDLLDGQVEAGELRWAEEGERARLGQDRADARACRHRPGCPRRGPGERRPQPERWPRCRWWRRRRCGCRHRTRARRSWPRSGSPLPANSSGPDGAVVVGVAAGVDDGLAGREVGALLTVTGDAVDLLGVVDAVGLGLLGGQGDDVDGVVGLGRVVEVLPSAGSIARSLSLKSVDSSSRGVVPFMPASAPAVSPLAASLAALRWRALRRSGSLGRGGRFGRRLLPSCRRCRRRRHCHRQRRTATSPRRTCPRGARWSWPYI